MTDTHIPIPEDRPVRVRIAPSPTGDPHVGTAYVALFNLMFARKHGGRFVLRIEDTDQVRSTRASEEAIFDSLRWLGLLWDEGPDVGGDYGPYRQSERTEHYQRHAAELIERGLAYHCFATAEELAEMRESARRDKRNVAYDRRYRDLDRAEVRRRLDAGDSYVIRLKMPLDGETTFTDGLRGEITIANSQLDDQILLKSDGFPTYHLANVVDDHLMEITHVIRGEEWIPSTPKHVQLYRAFGWEQPTFIHLGLLRNEDRSKISKRKNPVSLEYYRAEGYLPQAMVNFLGRMGFSLPDDREKFTLDEMLAEFSFERVSPGGPVFGLDKLDWLNAQYLKELSPEALTAELTRWLLSPEYLQRIAPLASERIKRLGDFVEMTPYFFTGQFPLEAEQLIPKAHDKRAAYRVLKSVTEAVDELATWTEDAIETTLRAECAKAQWKPRDFFMPVRLIITGRQATPPLFGTMEVIGKARCQARLRRGMTLLRP